MEMELDKRALRALGRSRRSALDLGTRRRAAGEAARHILALPEVRHARRVAVYAPFRDEMDVGAVTAALHGRGIVVLLPRIAAGRIELVEIGPSSPLEPGFRGVLEPAGAPVPDLDLDAIVVPGVTFDRAGGRVGQGGGHYDRLLSALPEQVIRIGVCFEAQIAEAVPRDHYDEPVDIVVTEAGVSRTEARGLPSQPE